jgi:hypothetical protein
MEYNCVYNVRVYPSPQMEDDFHTNAPYIFVGSLLTVFLFTALVFVTYDRLVEHRRRKVVMAAADDRTQVEFLFPEE